MKTISVFYCLLYATWTEGADIHVEGLERGEVSFECSHKLAWLNIKYFCKDMCKEAEDVLVSVKSGSRAESGRITLVDSGNGAFTVTFRQLQQSDSGRYWCGVDRPGFDTYTAVFLTVKEVITTAIPVVSPTWTYQHISSSTPQTFGEETSYTSAPINQSTASNSNSGGEQGMRTSTVLHATVGGIVILTSLVLAARYRKCRPFIRADKTEFDCEYGNIGEGQSIKKISDRTSSSRRPKPDPSTSASASEAECVLDLHIYENIRTDAALSRYSAANVQNNHGITSGVHTKPLPPIMSERAGDGCLRQDSNKPTAKSTERESCARNVATSHSRSSSESRPRSLWFGLDLSRTV
ncbi:trem-like transcript 4 protein [Trachinotus anak]|uniref:trem-like transcript 4 protein n=1 Tax=Trachinotus anak TaxID=443729 RepID=UPI0039F184AE